MKQLNKDSLENVCYIARKNNIDYVLVNQGTYDLIRPLNGTVMYTGSGGNYMKHNNIVFLVNNRLSDGEVEFVKNSEIFID